MALPGYYLWPEPGGCGSCGSPVAPVGGPGLVLGTVPSGRRPALIGTRWRRPAGRIDLARCSSRAGWGRAGRSAGFPRCGDTPGKWLFMWLWQSLATQHVGGERGIKGHAGSGEEGLEAGDP